MVELVAHDLRNYFANILFATELMQAADDLPPGPRVLTESIRSSAGSGMLFLQAFLEQQEHVAGGACVEPLPVRQMLCEAVQLLELSADAKAIRLHLPEHETLVVSGLRVGVAHVLQNLLSNAIKYSPRDSRVGITACMRGKRGRMMVMDRGPGISKSDQERLFQRFVRLSSAPTAGEESTGLGLALAKQQARAMGGDLWHEARDGGGSIFVFDLPLA